MSSSIRATSSQLTRLALMFLAVAVTNQALDATSTYLSASIGWGTTNALRTHLFRHTLRLDMSYHKARTPGELIERIDGDVTHLSNFLSQFVVRVAGSVLLVIGILLLLWREDWRVGLVLTVYVSLVVWVLNKRREVAVPATQLEYSANAQTFGFIEERLTRLDDIRANGAGPYTMQRFQTVQREWFQNTLRAWLLRSTIWSTSMFLFIAGHILTLGMGIGLFQAGLITLGTAYLFLNYMTMLEAPLDEVTRQLQEFQRAGAAFRRVQEMLHEEQEVLDGPIDLDALVARVPDASAARTSAAAVATALVDTPVAPLRQGHHIEFKNVWFAYEQQHVLKGVNFQLAPGQTMGLLGRTGSGKTTLVRLLFRLHDVTQGAILLDGSDLRTLTLRSLRRRIGLVTQDVQLFQGTVRDNLAFFDPTVSDDTLMAVLAELGLADWVDSLPNGLYTSLGAGGSGLSAGESQLLAFARVFLQNPGVVILDEPSSRLDPVTEKLLTEALMRLLAGRTGIIIAHRLETVARVDKIMVLSGGRVAEFGDRAALAVTPGSAYHTMLTLSARAGLDEQLERLGL